MIQETKNLKTEIIMALDFLPTDSLRLLAKFVTFLQTNVTLEEIEKLEPTQRPIRIFSPRLAHQQQIADFRKEVIWEKTDDSL
jgi:hypothetical protein